VQREIRQNCAPIIAEFKRQQAASNAARKREYERRMAEAQRAYNEEHDRQTKQKAKDLESLAKAQKTMDDVYNTNAVEMADSLDRFNNWASKMVILEQHAYNVLGSADNLLFIVKTYKQKVKTALDELKSLRDGALAPGWFTGKNGEKVPFDTTDFSDIKIDEEDELTELTGAAELEAEFNKFESTSSDVLFNVFAGSMSQEFIKIDEQATQALKDLHYQIDHWGKPTGH